MKESKTPTLLERLFAIMEAVPFIEKDATNSFAKYKYASERVIKARIHEELVKNRVLFKLEVIKTSVEDGITKTYFRYKFLNVDDVADSLEGTFAGTGTSRDEKGYYASITGAIKYIFTSMFVIPTGDDPENDKFEAKVKDAFIPKTEDRTGMITDPQIRKIHSLTNNDTERMAAIKNEYGVFSMNDLKIGQASEIIQKLILAQNDNAYNSGDNSTS